MWATLSASRWIGLLPLALVMPFSASQGHTDIHIRCCYGGGNWTKVSIELCIKQTPRRGCSTSAYLVKPVSGHWECINANSRWLKKKLQKGEIKCTSAISERRFEVLDDDDVE